MISGRHFVTFDASVSGERLDRALAALGLDMRRAISAAMIAKPATISRPITITSTFSHRGA